jgi:hypothetical protein
MRKDQAKKLALTTDTVRRLTSEELRLTAGGSSKICGTSDWCTQVHCPRTVVG